MCVCLSVCLSTSILELQVVRRLLSDTNGFSTTSENNVAILLKNALLESEKLVQFQTVSRGPAHQSAMHMHVASFGLAYLLWVHLVEPSDVAIEGMFGAT